MKTRITILILAAGMALAANTGHAAPKPAAKAALESRVTIELQDGSRVVGKLDTDRLPFESVLLGDFKLAVERIRSLQWKPGTNVATLKAVNGDEFQVRLAADELRVKTSFGEVRLPVASLRQMQISTWRGTVNLKEGLVALWSGEGSARDSVEGHNGEMLNGAGFTTGKVGRAFQFSTAAGRAYFADAEDFKFAGAFTLAGWVRVTEYPPADAGGCIMVRGDNRPGLDPFVIGTHPESKLVFSINSKDGQSEMVTAPGRQGEWLHMACVFDADAGRMQLYLDGKLAAEKQTSIKPIVDLEPSQDPSVCLGNVCGRYHTFPFRGWLDEWAAYGRALSPAEIQSLVDLGNAGQHILPPSTAK